MTMSASARFWAKVDRSSDCWTWTATRDSRGYGQFWFDGKLVAAHRWSWEEAAGHPVAAGLTLDHLCVNESCVRPSHLEPVTMAENMRRGVTRKTGATADRCGQGHPRNDWEICQVCNRAKARRHTAKRRGQEVAA